MVKRVDVKAVGKMNCETIVGKMDWDAVVKMDVMEFWLIMAMIGSRRISSYSWR